MAQAPNFKKVQAPEFGLSQLRNIPEFGGLDSSIHVLFWGIVLQDPCIMLVNHRQCAHQVLTQLQGFVARSHDVQKSADVHEATLCVMFCAPQFWTLFRLATTVQIMQENKCFRRRMSSRSLLVPQSRGRHTMSYFCASRV